MASDSDIFEAASRLRRAIERCQAELTRPCFESFPRGSCGDATPFLGAYLKDLGFGVFDYVLGTRGDVSNNTWHSHAWAQQANLIVDVTADQFPEIKDPVIVIRDSEWHKTFQTTIEQAADHRIYDKFTVDWMSADYETILKYL